MDDGRKAGLLSKEVAKEEIQKMRERDQKVWENYYFYVFSGGVFHRCWISCDNICQNNLGKNNKILGLVVRCIASDPMGNFVLL